ncbi:hypothetical protein SKAU_G00051780 [Synaphobranchus kaupii]|uniref:Uncharacterized protein n=1 Tax=Synaphobranchus kaupii TaxID=118154 RepID=A0A9Q1J9I3_SYNKA|nr:hypothetical protein SKAU_G00051780 [Synaphobranchus kaupii]
MRGRGRASRRNGRTTETMEMFESYGLQDSRVRRANRAQVATSERLALVRPGTLASGRQQVAQMVPPPPSIGSEGFCCHRVERDGSPEQVSAQSTELLKRSADRSDSENFVDFQLVDKDNDELPQTTKHCAELRAVSGQTGSCHSGSGRQLRTAGRCSCEEGRTSGNKPSFLTQQPH